MFETVLVPLDGSRRAEAILPPVTFLAKGLGSRVTLLYVLESTVETADAEIEAEALRQMESVRSPAEGYLQEMACSLRQESITVDAVVRAGKPHKVICNYATEGALALWPWPPMAVAASPGRCWVAWPPTSSTLVPALSCWCDRGASAGFGWRRGVYLSSCSPWTVPRRRR